MAQRRLGAPVAAAQELLERVAEVLGAQSVDERIVGRVAVAEPEEDAEQERRGAVSTERLGEIDGEERSPADHETADDDAHRFSRLLLLVETAQLGDDVQLGKTRRDQRRALLGR